VRLINEEIEQIELSKKRKGRPGLHQRASSHSSFLHNSAKKNSIGSSLDDVDSEEFALPKTSIMRGRETVDVPKGSSFPISHLISPLYNFESRR